MKENENNKRPIVDERAYCRAISERDERIRKESITRPNEARRHFIDEYLRYKKSPNNEISYFLKDAATVYKLTDKGWRIGAYPIDYELIDASDKLLNQFYEEIKGKAGQRFLEFYENYKEKIRYDYDKYDCDLAISDLKTAYYTYKKCFTPDWNCPDDKFITLNEMKNLHKDLNQDRIRTSGEDITR